jgi:hypothetical protein
MDAMLLYSETPNLHTHTLKVAVIDAGPAGDFTFDVFRRTLPRRLHLLDPLRYKPIDIRSGANGQPSGILTSPLCTNTSASGSSGPNGGGLTGRSAQRCKLAAISAAGRRGRCRAVRRWREPCFRDARRAAETPRYRPRPC